MIYIIEIDGEISTKYTYNVWSVVEFRDEDNIALFNKDTRILATDDVNEFTSFVAKLKQNPDFNDADWRYNNGWSKHDIQTGS